MQIMRDLVAPDAIVPALRATSKKQVLLDLAKRAAALTALDSERVFDALLEREKLGSTAVGNGIAIPHARLRDLDRVVGLYARLERPIDFDAIDDQPVDLVFVLLTPADATTDHLKALAKVSRTLRDLRLCDKLRGSDSAEAVFALLCDETDSKAA